MRKEKENGREEREEHDMDFGGWSRKLRQEQEVCGLSPCIYGVADG